MCDQYLRRDYNKHIWGFRFCRCELHFSFGGPRGHRRGVTSVTPRNIGHPHHPLVTACAQALNLVCHEIWQCISNSYYLSGASDRAITLIQLIPTIVHSTWGYPYPKCPYVCLMTWRWQHIFRILVLMSVVLTL